MDKTTVAQTSDESRSLAVDIVLNMLTEEVVHVP